jgi:nucleotide-binding universal stress UspA family protein
LVSPATAVPADAGAGIHVSLTDAAMEVEMTAIPTIEEKVKVEKIPAKKLVSLARIMVATDFSPVSDRALEYAVSVARRFESRIYLTHVLTFGGHGMMEPEVGARSHEEVRKLAEESARKIKDSGRLQGIPHEIVIEEGSLWPTLENLIRKYEIDLLVLGTHGASGVLKVLAGSSAEQIFRQARIPVLTVGPAATGESQFAAEFKNILCATDFGPAAEREVAYAVALAQEHGARLMLLHVNPPPAKPSERDAVLQREDVTRKLEELVPGGGKGLCRPEFRLASGKPVEEILRLAKETKADLIVIGAKKRESLAGHIPHTKAYGVVCGAKCPVLTFKS